MSLFEFLENRSRSFFLAWGSVLALLIGVPDYLFGPGVSFSIFYLVPVAFTAWYAGRRAGVFMSFLSAAIWLAADVVAGNPFGNPYVPLWNAAVRLGFFLTVVFLLNAFKREKAFARQDDLTGLGNRRFFFELADTEIRRTYRYGRPFTVAYVDVDDFKSVNDELGHAEGDAVLRQAAEVMRSNIRSTDIAARLGGDEFALLLPESGADAAKKFMQKLHARLTDAGRKAKRAVTVSAGVVTFLIPPVSGYEMLRIVDSVMYAAKSAGKNSVRFEVVGG